MAVLWRDNQADNRDKGSGTWLVTGDQADDHQLDAAAWLGEATLVLDGIFGGLRDVRFTPKGGHQSVYGYTPLIAVCAGGSNIATIRLLAQRGHRSQGQARLLPPLNFGNPLSEYISIVCSNRGH